LANDRNSGARSGVDVAGLRFDPLDESAAVERVMSAFLRGSGGRAVFVNVDVAQKVAKEPDLAPLLSSADLVLADGMPLIWVSRLLGTPLPERVAGSTVLRLLAAQSASEGVPVMIVGGRPGSAEAAARALVESHPGLRAGWHTPPFGFESDPIALDALDHALDREGRCVCFVGLGFPKQERLMIELAKGRPDWWFIASGGGIDFLADGQRAPVWMQRSGLEWLHRLSREPKRLARRYLVDDIPFAARLFATATYQRYRGSGRVDPGLDG
jgi:N-acetylglucosaminyldiphosphoundecaprenol N-acetyl-beta-D-mannosaminyltransferase